MDPTKKHYWKPGHNGICMICGEEKSFPLHFSVIYRSMWHIIPIADTREHIHDIICHCKPRIIESNSQLIANHNAYDGREIVEEFNDKRGFENNLETKWGLYK